MTVEHAWNNSESALGMTGGCAGNRYGLVKAARGDESGGLPVGWGLESSSVPTARAPLKGAHKRRPYAWLFQGVHGRCRAGHRNCTAPGPRPTVGTGSGSGKTTLRRQDEGESEPPIGVGGDEVGW